MIPSILIKPLIGVAVIAAVVVGFLAWLKIHDASIRSVAEAKCTAEKTEMVSKAEADAIRAILARTQRELNAAKSAQAEADNRAVEADKAKQDALAALDALKSQAASDKSLQSPTESELQWLGRH